MKNKSKKKTENRESKPNNYSKYLQKAEKKGSEKTSQKMTNSEGQKKYKPNANAGHFPEFLHPNEVLRGLSSDPPTLTEGILRINPKNYEDAFISSPEAGDQDIYIKGVASRCRALNGDVVVVKLDSPEKWKVNHEVIQDFLDMKATEEQTSALMINCVVNPKKEAEERKDDINVQSVAKHYAIKTEANASAAEIPVIDIADDELDPDLVKNAVDPLEDIPQAGLSDYESGKSEDENDPEEEIVSKLGEVSIIDVSTTTESVQSDDEDVVVETVDGSPEVPQSDVESCSSKKSRRGKRGKKSGGEAVRGSVKRPPPRKPLVEFNILSVLKFPAWPELGFVQKTGKVVSIKERKHSGLAGGYIRKMNDGNPNYFLFSPTDSRVPRMKIPSSQAPPNFRERPELYEGVMFMARLEKWEKVNMALGQLIKSLGDSSDISVRTEALLLENNIDFSEFSEAVLRDLPDNCEGWTIPGPELKRRRDFREACVFTIDPATARDLDDALSVRELEDGRLVVGVHIADVSYFVRPGTSLDKAAGDRATSTYLVERVVPMLPRPLCEKLCSLNPHEDRLTFTVEWTINQRAEVLSEWFGRTVIRSCAKLSYQDAQALIDEGTVTGVEVAAPHDLEKVGRSVRIINDLAVKLRSRREASGALRLDQPKLCFTLNSDSGLPDGFKLHQHRASNKMIEEFMLLANMAVARKIYTTFPKIAVLRRHPHPKMDLLDKTMEQLGFLGIEIDGKILTSVIKLLSLLCSGLSSTALAQSIDRIKECGDARKLACVTSLLSKPMELARYFCTGLCETHEYHHYALNVPLYTHFTSPIRRYPDILVHRLLDAAVTGRQLAWRPTDVEQTSQHCNDKRLAAKKVGEASAELFLAVFIAECGPIRQAGVVTGVMDHSLDVLVLEMGVVKRVYVDRCGVSRHSFRRTAGVSYLDFYWEDSTKLSLTVLSKVDVVLERGDRDFTFIAVIEKPEQSGAVKEEDVITLD